MYCLVCTFIDQIASQSLHPRVYKCVFDGFEDISEVLQPLTRAYTGSYVTTDEASYFNTSRLSIYTSVSEFP